MKYSGKLLLVSALIFTLFLLSCMEKPEGVVAVENFNGERYLGTWYEIARLENSFERGLSKVTATYSRREDGGIKVVNRGYSAERGHWQESVGKAYFVEDKSTGYLKVSFWGPFYSPYLILDLDENYQYALVTGEDKSYLWILSRAPTLSEDAKGLLLAKAAALGFDVNALVYVDQD